MVRERQINRCPYDHRCHVCRPALLLDPYLRHHVGRRHVALLTACSPWDPHQGVLVERALAGLP